MKNSFIIKSFAFCVLVLSMTFLGYAADPAVNSVWTNAPLQIDAQGGDWQGADMISFDKANVSYAFRNDAENLYILIAFQNPRTIQNIEDTGVTFYIDVNGKKKKDYSITFFKKRITADEFIALLESQGETVPEERKTQIRGSEFYALYDNEVVNKKAKDAKPPEGQQVKPAVFRYARQQRVMVYEFMVPLNRAYEQAAGVGADPGAKIKFGIEWGGSTQRSKEAAAKRLGAQGSRASATRAGGLTSEARVNSGGPDLSAMRRMLPKKYTIWTDLTLAVNQ